MKRSLNRSAESSGCGARSDAGSSASVRLQPHEVRRISQDGDAKKGMRMRNLDTWEDLQQLLKESEAPDLDFKETLDPANADFAVEARKDIAALANTLGGHIVIGASTEMNRSRCTGFHGIQAPLAARLCELLEEQGKTRCRPAPFLSTRVIDVPNQKTKVVVLRVSMSPVAPVGASLQQSAGGHLVDKGWYFPYRVGSRTEELSPDQFGAYESMSSRRAAALLSGIPIEERSNLALQWDGDAENQVLLEDVRLDYNAVLLRSSPGRLAGGRSPLQNGVAIPLEQVVSVWRASSGQWHVAIVGEITSGGTYRPRP